MTVLLTLILVVASLVGHSWYQLTTSARQLAEEARP